jgi:hypothetical protein
MQGCDVTPSRCCYDTANSGPLLHLDGGPFVEVVAEDEDARGHVAGRAGAVAVEPAPPQVALDGARAKPQAGKLAAPT